MLRKPLTLALTAILFAFTPGPKNPKVEWSSNEKIKTWVVGYNDEGNLASISADKTTLSLVIYNSSWEEVKKTKASLKGYSGYPEYYRSGNSIFLLSDGTEKAGRGVFLQPFDMTEGTAGDKTKLFDLNKSEKITIGDIVHVPSPNNEYSLVFVNMDDGSEGSIIRYAVFTSGDGNVLYEGEFSIPAPGRKLVAEVLKANVSSTGQAFFVVQTAKYSGLDNKNLDAVNVELYIASKSKKNAEKSDFAEEIEENIKDISVKTQTAGNYIVYGTVEKEGATLADQVYIIAFDKAHEAGDSKLPGSENETLPAVKGKEKKKTYEDLKSTNNGSYDNYFGTDYILNSDGSSYLIMESGQLIQQSQGTHITFYYMAGNFEIIKLNKDLDKVWQKTFYKNGGKVTGIVRPFESEGSYMLNTPNGVIIHKGDELKIVTSEKTSHSKNAPINSGDQTGRAIFLSTIDAEGNIKKSNCGTVPEVSKAAYSNQAIYLGKNTLSYQIIGLKGGMVGLLDLN